MVHQEPTGKQQLAYTPVLALIVQQWQTRYVCTYHIAGKFWQIEILVNLWKSPQNKCLRLIFCEFIFSSAPCVHFSLKQRCRTCVLQHGSNGERLKVSTVMLRMHLQWLCWKMKQSLVTSHKRFLLHAPCFCIETVQYCARSQSLSTIRQIKHKVA